MSWLSKLSELIDGAKYSGKRLGALGETFIRASEDNPGYFQLPRVSQPGKYLDVIGERHGLHLYGTPDGGAAVLGPQGTFALESTAGRAAGDLEHMLRRDYDPERADMLRDAIRRGKLTPDTRMYAIDSMNAERNTGMAKLGYPALWEHILGQPDAANLPTLLSNSNTIRRTPNLAGALERWGDRAGDRLMIDPQQLDTVGGKGVAYGRLGNIEKIGLLNAWNAANTDMIMKNTLPYATEQGRGALGRAYTGGALDPTAFASEGDLGQVAGALREAGSRYNIANTHESLPIPGKDSLRRAAIVAEQLGSGTGLKPLDLSDRPWLTNGIARAKGGAV